jgi:ketosteroid isomerase-like protein
MPVLDAADIVRAYHAAWTTGDVAKARTYLADDLDFQGPIDRFTSADQFAQALAGFAGLLIRVDTLEEFFAGDRAALLYDCVTAPLGAMRTAEFFRLENGKIAQIHLVFDASELRKLMGR